MKDGTLRTFSNEQSTNIERLKKEKKLKWTDLKIGDVIKAKDDTISYLITAINYWEKSKSHLLISKGWIDDDCLEYWEKVEK